MGDRLVKTFKSAGLFLQVPLPGKRKKATLLSYVGINTGSKNGCKVGSEIVSKVGRKTGS